jgi:uncharacterized SAM-binding protein YcdF (DUF218 family)
MTPIGLLKAIGGPGSIGFLVVTEALTIAASVVFPRARPAVAAIGLATVAVYMLLALPVVATAIAAGLRPTPPLTDLRILDSVEVAVLLDGDNRLGRLRETLRIWHAFKPARLIVTGDNWLVERLVAEGVPAGVIIRDSASSTTLEQVMLVEKLVTGVTPRRVVLVASRLQMPRLAALSLARGFTPSFAPSAIDDEPPTSGARVFKPTYIALRVSRDALYEHAALAYYRWYGLFDSRRPGQKSPGPAASARGSVH